MKAPFLFLILLAISYFVYTQWSTPTLVPAPAPAIALPPVPFGIRKHVRQLFEEWKQRKLSPHVQSGTKIVPEHEIAQIRKALFSAGAYSEQALLGTVTSALLELGVSHADVSQVAGEVVTLRSEAPQKQLNAIDD